MHLEGRPVDLALLRSSLGAPTPGGYSFRELRKASDDSASASTPFSFPGRVHRLTGGSCCSSGLIMAVIILSFVRLVTPGEWSRFWMDASPRSSVMQIGCWSSKTGRDSHWSLIGRAILA